MRNKKTIIDLFAGVGGLSLGFEQAGYEVAFANEVNKDIANAYIKNRRTPHMLVGDITELNLSDIFGKFSGKIDVVVGGPPCQGYSQKGKRRTIHDNRNFLFKHYVRVIEIVKPKYFVMENVPNLLTAAGGFFKKEIYELFEKIGYTLNSAVLNAADYGVPQYRKRACVIGFHGKRQVAMPIPPKTEVTIWDAISDLAYHESGEGEETEDYRLAPESAYQTEMRKGAQKLHNHRATKHALSALKRLTLIPPEMGRECLPKSMLTKSIYSGTWTRMRRADKAVTITTRFDTPSSGEFTHPFLNRAITVREAARIQSFPDTFIFYGTKTSQMKQVGNAVPPKLAMAIALAISQDAEEHRESNAGEMKVLKG